MTLVPEPTGAAINGGRRRLHVAVVTETWPPEVNGVAMTIHRMVDGLRTHHDVSLIRIRQGNTDTGITLDGVDTLLLRGMPLPRYSELRMGLPCTGLLKRRWRRERPDVVHIVTEGPLGWSAVLAARALNIPVVSDFHTNFHQYTAHYGLGLLMPVALRYLRALHNRTRLTLVPTRALAVELECQGFLRLEVLERGIDTDLFHPRHRRADLREAWGAGVDDPVMLMVSRVAPEKNLPLALRAYERAREQVPGVRMVVVGDGPARKAFATAHPDVHFAGMQTGAPLAEHYASADIFLFPSLSETFGNVTLEAMASGLAVVAFDYAAAREHIVDGRNGRTVACSDDDSFIRAATELAAGRAQAARLAAAARTTTLELDWSRICRRYEDILHEMCPEPAGG